VLLAFIQTTKSIFHPFVGGARTPVAGGSGILDIGIGTAGLFGSKADEESAWSRQSLPGSRNQPL